MAERVGFTRSEYKLRILHPTQKNNTSLNKSELLFWRREWDSNPRVLSHKLISSQPRYDHFDISPSMLSSVWSKTNYSIFYRTGRPVMSCCGTRNFLLAIRFAKFRPLPLLFAPFIRHRRRSQTSPLRYLSVFDCA